MHRARESYCGRLVEGEPMRLDWSPPDTVAEAGAELARCQGCNAIVLCGGVFLNKLFLERVSEKSIAIVLSAPCVPLPGCRPQY